SAEEAEKYRVSPIEFKIPEEPSLPKPAAESEVPTKAAAETPVAAPAPVEAGDAPLRGTSLDSSVPESYGAWVPAMEGSRERIYNKDYGFEGGGNNKEQSNTKAVFQTPEGNIAV